MPDLYCPQCEYNLTGLTQNRCPECGRPFDAEEIDRLTKAAPKPISLQVAAFHLIVPPLAYNLLVPVFFKANVEFLFGTLALAVLIYGIVNGLSLTSRLFVTRAVRMGRPTYARPTLSLMLWGTAVFLFLQVSLALGGCYARMKLF